MVLPQNLGWEFQPRWNLAFSAGCSGAAWVEMPACRTQSSPPACNPTQGGNPASSFSPPILLLCVGGVGVAWCYPWFCGTKCQVQGSSLRFPLRTGFESSSKQQRSSGVSDWCLRFAGLLLTIATQLDRECGSQPVPFSSRPERPPSPWGAQKAPVFFLRPVGECVGAKHKKFLLVTGSHTFCHKEYYHRDEIKLLGMTAGTSCFVCNRRF